MPEARGQHPARVYHRMRTRNGPGLQLPWFLLYIVPLFLAVAGIAAATVVVPVVIAVAVAVGTAAARERHHLARLV